MRKLPGFRRPHDGDARLPRRSSMNSGERRRVRALIFDFDGLIVDSESPGFQAWSEVFQSHGCTLPFDKYSACIGTIEGFDLHGYLEQQSGRSLDRKALLNA